MVCTSKNPTRHSTACYSIIAGTHFKTGTEQRCFGVASARYYLDFYEKTRNRGDPLLSPPFLPKHTSPLKLVRFTTETSYRPLKTGLQYKQNHLNISKCTNTNFKRKKDLALLRKIILLKKLWLRPENSLVLLSFLARFSA